MPQCKRAAAQPSTPASGTSIKERTCSSSITAGPRCARSRQESALAEKNLEWDGQLLTLGGDQFDPQYLKLNPNTVVPTLVHEGNVIIESTAIIHYLNDVFPNPPLMPPPALARSRVHMSTKLIDEYVHNSCTALTFATANRAPLARLRG